MNIWRRWNGEVIFVEPSRFANAPVIGRAFLEPAAAVTGVGVVREIGWYNHGQRDVFEPFPGERVA